MWYLRLPRWKFPFCYQLMQDDKVRFIKWFGFSKTTFFLFSVRTRRNYTPENGQVSFFFSFLNLFLFLPNFVIFYYSTQEKRMNVILSEQKFFDRWPFYKLCFVSVFCSVFSKTKQALVSMVASSNAWRVHSIVDTFSVSARLVSTVIEWRWCRSLAERGFSFGSLGKNMDKSEGGRKG